MRKKKNSRKLTSSGNVIVVQINDELQPYLFGSAAAIFGRFSAEQIGMSLDDIWKCHLRKGEGIETNNARIFKCDVLRCQQK